MTSTQTLMEMRCDGRISLRPGMSGVLMIGSSATTIGNSRTLLRQTASAVSIRLVPVPSAVTRMTWAGPAQSSAVDSIAQPTEKPKSWASAPKPTYVTSSTSTKTEADADRTPR